MNTATGKEYVVLINRFDINEPGQFPEVAWRIREEEADLVPQLLLRWIRVNLGWDFPYPRTGPVRNDDDVAWRWIVKMFKIHWEWDFYVIYPHRFVDFPESDRDLLVDADEEVEEPECL